MSTLLGQHPELRLPFFLEFSALLASTLDKSTSSCGPHHGHHKKYGCTLGHTSQNARGCMYWLLSLPRVPLLTILIPL